MIQASPQMADRLRRIRLRPVVTNLANVIIIDKLQKRISAGGPGSGPHPGSGKELWQQTRKEAGVGEAPVIPDAHRPLHKLYGPNWEQHPDIANLKKEVSRVNGLRSKAIKEHKQYVQRSNEHLQSVRDAINQGKQVPPDVMNDYPFIKASIKADGSINWTSPSGPVGPDWYDAYIGTSPIPNDHPPSLKNPKLTKIPLAQDGWKKGDSKKAKDQAMDDLVEIHKRLRRQTGKPEVSFPALNPVYPTGVTGSAILDNLRQRISAGGPGSGRHPGVLSYDTLYHGTPKANVSGIEKTGLRIDKSQRTDMGAIPAISVTDNLHLAQAFVRGDLGFDPAGKVFTIDKHVNVLDLETPEGRAIHEKLGKDPATILKHGYDGVAFDNLEDMKIRTFYKDVDSDKAAPGKEIQLYRNVEPHEIKAVGVVAYSEDEARDDHGRWTSGNTVSDEAQKVHNALVQNGYKVSGIAGKRLLYEKGSGTHAQVYPSGKWNHINEATSSLKTGQGISELRDQLGISSTPKQGTSDTTTLTTKESEALKAYRGANASDEDEEEELSPHYKDVNDYLRSGSGGTPQIKSTIAGLDSAIGKSTLSADTQLYRGASLPSSMVSSFSVGSQIQDKAFVSTSTDRGVATQFMDGGRGTSDVVFTIRAPKGSNALTVDGSSEKEVLLPRGSSFKIDSISKASNGEIHVSVYLVKGTK